MSERDIERWLGDQLKKRGALYYKFTSPGARGVPDRLAITPDGRVVFIELKDDNGRVSDLQRAQIMRLRRQHVPAFVVRGKSGAADFLKIYDDIAGGRYEV